MQDVFVSYSSRNKEVADYICRGLEDAGIKCWIAPRNIIAGREWGEQIIRGIESSRVMVLVFSEASNESVQVIREVERAVSKGLPIINFRIQDIVPTGSMEYFLYTNHWIDSFDEVSKESIEQLILAVEEVREVRKIEKRDDNIASGHMSVHLASTRKMRKYKKHITFVGGIAIGAGLIGGIFSWNDMRQSVKEIDQQKQVEVSSATEEGGQESIGTTNQEGTKPNTVEANSGKVEDKDNKETTIKKEGQNAGSEQTIGKEETAGSGNVEEGHSGTEDIIEGSPNTGDEIAGGTNQGQESGAATGNDGEQEVVEEVQETIQLKIGDYIRFGTYLGTPIDWIVIRVKEDGSPLLISKQIVSLKAMDAAESGNSRFSKAGEKFDGLKERDESEYALKKEMREMMGSSHWGSSNLRTWLNSDERKVIYSGVAPTEKSVGSNAYYKETGFLNGFTEQEKSSIQKHTYKSVLAAPYKERKVGGTESFGFKPVSVLRKHVGIKESLYNISNAYYEQLTDRVFLLSVEELVEYMEDEYIEIKATMTQGAKDRDESRWAGETPGEEHMWWLRTPVGNTWSQFCVVNTKGDGIYSEHAVKSGVGVRPSLYLDMSKASWQGGGSEVDPYQIK